MAQARYGGRRRLVHLLLAPLLLGAAAPRRPVLIWAFGDSLTAGYGLPPDQGLTAQLQARLRRDGVPATVRNGGVSGDTSAQGLARLRWGLRGLPGAPDLVMVELGANDMLRGLPPEQAMAHLDAILAELRRRRLHVLLIGMRASPNLGRVYQHAFDGLYPALAGKYRVPLYPFYFDGVVGRPALIQADGLHPDARGVAIIVARLAPKVEGALRR